MPPLSSDPNVTGHSAIVLFDPESGAVHHIHQVISLEGADQPSGEELERAAREHALEKAKRYPGLDLPPPPKRLEAMHIDPSDLNHHGSLRVDVKAHKLVHVRRRSTRR
jgi:hypothetical protein